MKINESKIFTKAELKELERRKANDRSDKHGLFSARIKPKIMELLDHWFPQKKQLQKLIVSKKKKQVKKR